MKKVIDGLGQVFSMTLTFIIVIAASMLIARLAVGAGLANIKGVSMEPSLSDGQVYLYTQRSPIERYDIVLSEFHSGGVDKILVKRVIGIPGDDLTVINGKLYIDGLYYEEPYISDDVPEFEFESFRANLGEDEYFLMGDNRDHSLDSRDELGVVHRDSIIGVIKRDITDIMKGVKFNE